MRRRLLLAAALGAALPRTLPAAPPRPAPYGVLLLAHGGEPSWNAEIELLRRAADREVPTEAALGMADPGEIGRAVARLEARGAAKIVAVPLFVNSRSEVMDQTRYVLGLADESSGVLREASRLLAARHGGEAHAAHGHGAAGGVGHRHLFSMERSVPRVPTVLTDALDADEAVTRILLARARALSREPARETVILAAHGPVDEGAVPAWERALSAHAARLRAAGFAGAEGRLLRDDAPPPVRAAAVSALRAAVARAASSGRALVVPVLLARGGIEGKLARDLEGLDFAWDGRTLLPEPGFDGWILARARAGARLPDMRRPRARGKV